MRATRAHMNNASATVQLNHSHNHMHSHNHITQKKQKHTKQKKYFFINAVLVWFLHGMNSRDPLLSFVRSLWFQKHRMNWLRHHRT